MNPNIKHDLEVRFKAQGADGSSFKFLLQQIREFLGTTARFDPFLKDTEWFLATGERESSYQHRVFDANGPRADALAELDEEAKESDHAKSLSIWNGQENRTKGASISSLFGRKNGVASSFKLSLTSPREKMRLGEWSNVAEALALAVKVFAPPIYGSVGTLYYDPVFSDRPGVGWMLYLPRVLTDQQVPEARALVPVMGKNAKGKDAQTGTIIVSVTDEPFTEHNPEHVKIANAIEIRLVDQDLLPRYADL